MSKIVINVVGGVVQEVISDNKEIDVILVDFDLDDSKELSEKYVDLLDNPKFELKELKDL